MSSSSITALDKTDVHRICSGQVVLNLATAVKELVENSIDAGATCVEVKLKEYGSEIIEVTDNGSGVNPTNFEGLTMKHHTSKLRDFSDLVSVETFGFRGEALSSLCALSEITVFTRNESEEYGTLLSFDNDGNITDRKQLARQIGTTVTLKNIFSTLPVRQKEFHKNLKREFVKMTQLLYAYCLISTGVKISCSNKTKAGNRSVVVKTNSSQTVKENINSVFGHKQTASLIEFKKTLPSSEELKELKATEDDCEIFQFQGFVSTCEHGCGRSSADRQFYYVNSRPCEPSKIAKAVNEIYRQFNVHQYPFVYLNISVLKGSVDVNVVPDKRQVFLNKEKLLIAIIRASLTEMFKAVPSIIVLSNTKKQSESSNEKLNVSVFSQWRHKDSKRELEDQIETAKSKKIKMEAIENSQSKLSQFYKQDSSCLKAQIKRSESEETPHFDKIVQKGRNEDIKHNSCISITTTKPLEEEGPMLPILPPVEIECDNTIEIFKEPRRSEGSNKQLFEQIDCLDTEVVKSQPVEQRHSPVRHDQDSISTQHAGSQLDSHSQAIIENKIVLLNSYTERDKNYMTLDWSLNTIKQSKSDRSTKKPRLRFTAAIDPKNNEQAENELRKEISKDMFEKMEIIGQFNHGFIIVKLDSDLFIIDQHASDEKFNFETLQKKTTINNQKLVIPQPLELTATNETILIDNLDVFKKNGFEFILNEAPLTKRVLLSAIPMSKNKVFGKSDVDELIFMLQDSPSTDCRPSAVRAMFASRACRMSVMIGDPLSGKEMRRLVTQMGTIDQPWNCPHGRPTIRHLVSLNLV